MKQAVVVSLHDYTFRSVYVIEHSFVFRKPKLTRLHICIYSICITMYPPGYHYDGFMAGVCEQ